MCLSDLPLSSITVHVHAHQVVILCAQEAKLPTCFCTVCSLMGRLLIDSDFGRSKFLCIYGAVLVDYTTSISEDEIFESGTWKAQISLYCSVAHIPTSNPCCTKMIQLRSAWMCTCTYKIIVCSRD
jgi:hypothetical protein